MQCAAVWWAEELGNYYLLLNLTAERAIIFVIVGGARGVFWGRSVLLAAVCIQCGEVMDTRVEAVIIPLQEILVKVQALSDSDEEVDRILFGLSCSSFALGELLTSIVVRQELTVQPEMLAQLRELHWCTDNVLLEWERRLPYAMSSVGRNKKPINVPMVSRLLPRRSTRLVMLVELFCSAFGI